MPPPERARRTPFAGWFDLSQKPQFIHRRGPRSDRGRNIFSGGFNAHPPGEVDVSSNPVHSFAFSACSAVQLLFLGLFLHWLYGPRGSGQEGKGRGLLFPIHPFTDSPIHRFTDSPPQCPLSSGRPPISFASLSRIRSIFSSELASRTRRRRGSVFDFRMLNHQSE